MAKVTGLGHVGLFVHDMPKMLNFYTSVLGMTVTDRGGESIVFLSARPAQEHHELALAYSTDQVTEAGQVSFHVDSLERLKGLYHKVKDYGCTLDRVVNHGIAFGAYFRDPEDNRVEVYRATGIDYPQPFAEPVDLDAPAAELLQALDALPPRKGTGDHWCGRNVGKRIRVRSQEAERYAGAGLTVTDGGDHGARAVFLSADPAREHHEFVLGIRPDHRSNAQQISFTVSY